MKVRIEIDSDIKDTEVVIRCSSINDSITKIQSFISDMDNNSKQIIYYQDNKEFYLPLDRILFFETDAGVLNAHSSQDIYLVKYKLYELEDILPGYFTRVSKSTILNTNAIYSITKNITSASIVEFEGSYKTVFVSRSYYKPLKEKLEEKRLGT